MQNPTPPCAGFRRAASCVLRIALHGTGLALIGAGTAFAGTGRVLKICGRSLRTFAARKHPQSGKAPSPSSPCGAAPQRAA